ncbi:hypothetical protein CASFOL_009032 [Castilleja foliolosa]|uniref:RING-type E3 ubiquitin transferase n=1 Tax=Castilleja foliolosa TaxID=1961234 RepID=A0ABD3E4R7_9LAMI
MNKDKLMTISGALLLVAWFFLVVIHVFFRYCCRRRNADSHHQAEPWATVSCSRGLDPSAVNSIPTFIYVSKSEEPQLECAVCLSEFEEGETGRVMPNCNHSFHVECIDMWLRSHCDCPLCRTRVRASDPVEPVENPRNFVSINVAGPGSMWRSGIHTFLFSV